VGSEMCIRDSLLVLQHLSRFVCAGALWMVALMTMKRKPGFRFVPWRLSWKIFALTFLAFLGVNYIVVHLASRQPLFSRQRDDIDGSIRSIEANLSDVNQDLLTLRGKIEEIRITSATQRQTIQDLEKDLEAAGARLSAASKEAAKLSNANDLVSRAAGNQEQALDKIANDLADMRGRLQQVRDELAKSSSKP